MIYGLESTWYIFTHLTSTSRNLPGLMFRQLTQGIHLIPRNWARFGCSNWAKWGFGMQWGADMRECSFKPKKSHRVCSKQKFLKSTALLEVQLQKSWKLDGATKNNVFTLCNLGFSPSISRNHPNSSHIVQDPDLNFDSIQGSQHPLSDCHFDTSARIVAGQLTRPQDLNLGEGNTLDGRNPAPVDTVNLSLCTRG